MCLEESLYIHNIRDMKVLHTIRETPPNPAGKLMGFLVLPFEDDWVFPLRRFHICSQVSNVLTLNQAPFLLMLLVL